jgi:3-deoxy-D-arabino-heptulosonate 7-phosphate (DAHP) synthase class II
MHNEENICKEILELISSIRFAVIANKMGKLVAAKFNPGVKVLLTKDEIEANIIKAVLRMKTREDYEEKRGRTVYTLHYTRK